MRLIAGRNWCPFYGYLQTDKNFLPTIRGVVKQQYDTTIMTLNTIIIAQTRSNLFI